jgi:hypothetical protein
MTNLRWQRKRTSRGYDPAHPDWYALRGTSGRSALGVAEGSVVVLRHRGGVFRVAWMAPRDGGFQ